MTHTSMCRLEHIILACIAFDRLLNVLSFRPTLLASVFNLYSQGGSSLSEVTSMRIRGGIWGISFHQLCEEGEVSIRC